MKKTLFSLLLAAAFFTGGKALAAAPAAPANLTGTSTSATTINLSWDPSIGAVGYQIFKTSSVTPIATTSSTAYIDSGLAPNTAYTYWVTAYDASSTVSALSTSTSITTLADTIAPSVPLNLSALPASVSQINLAWSAATDNVAVTGYVVYRGGSPIATTTALSYSDTGLASTSSYTYNVLAFDAAGNYSALSAGATAMPQNDTIAPSVPTAVTGSAVSSSQINLSWTASTDNLGVAGYRVYRNGVLVGSPVTNSFSNTGLTASTTYPYQVSAIDAAGNESAKTQVIYVMTLGSGIGNNSNVTIAIKNGDKKGKLINLRSNEIIKVLVYSNANINARDIINSTVRFGGAKAIFWNLGHANRDRKLDREYWFNSRQMADLYNTDTKAVFTAKLKNGTTVYGEAKVRVVNSPKKKIIKPIVKIEKKIEQVKDKIENIKQQVEKKIDQTKTKLNNLIIRINNGTSTYATSTNANQVHINQVIRQENNSHQEIRQNINIKINSNKRK